MIKLLSFTFILIALYAAPSWGEYRAYQYVVKSNDPYAVATKAKAQFITSTLSPQAFQSFHGGSSVTVDLLRTWICSGYTGKKEVCAHPYDQEEPKL